MQIIDEKIYCPSSTLNQLMSELQEECQNVITLMNQLESSEFTKIQKGEILSELLVASIHLHSHCDEDFQHLLSNDLEKL